LVDRKNVVGLIVVGMGLQSSVRFGKASSSDFTGCFRKGTFLDFQGGHLDIIFHGA